MGVHGIDPKMWTTNVVDPTTRGDDGVDLTTFVVERMDPTIEDEADAMG